MRPRRFAAGLLFAALASPAAAAPLHAVCTLERPIIGYGEHVAVTAFTDAPAGTPIQVTWSADGGTFSQGSAPASAVWAPNTQARGVFTIQARVVTSGETADCTTLIAVSERLTRSGNETLISMRTLLAPDAQEAAGYGLYSYILFAKTRGRPGVNARGIPIRRALAEIQAQSNLNSPSNGNCTIVTDRNAPFSVRDIAAAKSVAFINTLLFSGWAVDALHPVHEVHPMSV